MSGTGRLMFGSDWPVAILAGDYAKVWRETGVLLAGLGENDRAAVLGGTGARFYGIEV
ncbi:amidohydrolase family protein [Streptosporangium sp. NPDC001681]|uniref:amidohydrolase family protein n=1 Tax=Streptosporangium sp. NPDC001681 TaxID=3154395 RepID=UPI00332882D8